MSETSERLPRIPTGFGPIEHLLRQSLHSRLSAVRHGCLRVVDALGTIEFGGTGGGLPHVEIVVVDASFYRALAASGSVGAAEAYSNGWWRCSDLVGLVRLLLRHRDLLDGMEQGPARISGWIMRALDLLRVNTRRGAHRNIAAHYDLGNELFGLFLSPDLMYSCALFADPQESLESASMRKLERICEKLHLGPNDRVIEIGSGWGGFAVHAAARYGCHVTTTTISRAQYDLARERIAAAGLEDQITVLLDDYRDLRGCYDKLVSIEMVEAIGASQLDTYFGKIGSLLEADGKAVIQAITIQDHRYVQALRSVDFIKRHIFPGSFIPSVAALIAAKTRSTDLALTHLEDFGSSYALTLRIWRERFLASLADVRALGYDERFIRLWEFYLAYCEGGFRERSIGVAQLLLTKPGCRDAEYLPALKRFEA